MIARCGGEGSPEVEDEWDGGDSGRPQSTGSVPESPSGGTALGLHNAVGYFRKAVERGRKLLRRVVRQVGKREARVPNQVPEGDRGRDRPRGNFGEVISCRESRYVEDLPEEKTGETVDGGIRTGVGDGIVVRILMGVRRSGREGEAEVADSQRGG